ncbi:MAG TPA: MoaD/ThiS family protein [Candidatus Brachybacterium merdigallinarum]|nr:MoaD/ThiS family protein [Candidatus Brachybacterium merdigallinarum]
MTPAAPTTQPAPAIEVHLFAAAAAEYGSDRASLRATTVGAAIQRLQEGASAEARQVIGRSSVLLNSIACTDLDRELTDGDRLDVLPPFAGG